MDQNQLIIDVREPSEYQSGHVDGALNIPPAELLAGSAQLKTVPKSSKIIVYCRTGSRANVAIEILKQQGFSNLVNGINAGHVTDYLAKH